MNTTEFFQLAGLLGIAFLGLPTLGWFCSIHHRRPLGVQVAIFGAVVAAGTVLHFWRIELRYLGLRKQLDGYEQNGSIPSTPEAQAVQRAYASDTARAFAPYVALPVALVWAGLNYGGWSLLAWGFYALLGRRWPRDPSQETRGDRASPDAGGKMASGDWSRHGRG